MHQLHRSIPLVFRSPGCVQFGTEDPVLLDGLTPADVALLEALRMGVDEERFTEAAGPGGERRARSLLALLDEAGVLVPEDELVHARIVTPVFDACAAASGVSPGLVATAVTSPRICVLGPLRVPLVSQFVAAGFAARGFDSLEDALARPSPVLVLTGIWAPDLLGADQARESGVGHLLVTLGHDRAEISHLVDPTTTPCTKCWIGAKLDEDAQWLVGWRELSRLRPDPGVCDPVLVSLALAQTVAVLRETLTAETRTGSGPVPRTTLVRTTGVDRLTVDFHPTCRVHAAVGTREAVTR